MKELPPVCEKLAPPVLIAWSTVMAPVLVMMTSPSPVVIVPVSLLVKDVVPPTENMPPAVVTGPLIVVEPGVTGLESGVVLLVLIEMDCAVRIVVESTRHN